MRVCQFRHFGSEALCRLKVRLVEKLANRGSRACLDIVAAAGFSCQPRQWESPEQNLTRITRTSTDYTDFEERFGDGLAACFIAARTAQALGPVASICSCYRWLPCSPCRVLTLLACRRGMIKRNTRAMAPGPRCLLLHRYFRRG